MSRKWKPKDGGREIGSYTNKSSRCYDSDFDKAIREKHPEWFVDTAAEKKRELLAMPIGCERPAIGKHHLASMFNTYICKVSECYDPVFDKAIRKRQPGWFVDTVAENKKQLLAMPVGCERPSGETPIGHSLTRYISKKSNCYDPVFDKTIRERQPSWFVDTVAENKKQLLAMSHGCNRPSQGKHCLARPLSRYTNKKSNCYDPVFDKAIRVKQPGWFVDTVAESKRRLLAMPIGCDSPPQRTPIGRILWESVREKSSGYDPAFDKSIRQRQPGWWESKSDKMKKRLLALPVGSKRPNCKKTEDGKWLCNLTRKRSDNYDPIFDKAIRKRQHGWFVNTAVENKKKLLAMPVVRKKPSAPLSYSLNNYTRKSSPTSYDPIFDKAIRNRQPGWFKR